MRAKLIKPVTAVLQDVPALLTTIPAGAVVEFQPTAQTGGVVGVTCEGKLYSALLVDLLDATRLTDTE